MRRHSSAPPPPFATSRGWRLDFMGFLHHWAAPRTLGAALEAEIAIHKRLEFLQTIFLSLIPEAREVINLNSES